MITWTADSLDSTGKYQCNMTYSPGAIGNYQFTGGTLVGAMADIIMVGIVDISTQTYARVSQEAKISCRIRGGAQATWIRWYKTAGDTVDVNNDAQVSSSFYTTYYYPTKLETESIVTWESSKVVKALSGNYYCKGLYSAGVFVSDLVVLSVLDVGITKAPETAKVKIEADAKFTCAATKNSDYIPTIKWFKQGTSTNTELKTTANEYKVESTDATDEVTSVLTILTVATQDKGNCFIQLINSPL